MINETYSNLKWASSYLIALGGVCAAVLFCLMLSESAHGQKSTDKGTQARPAGERFRVTMTGFTVNRQSNDNILESDGKGDEVYVVADVAQYDSRWLYDRQRWLGRMNELLTQSMGTPSRLHGRGNLSFRHSYNSLVMGDIGNDDLTRVSAGTAGDGGGLRTGDRFPTNEPWNLRGTPRANRLPMLIWEGTLRPGMDLVMIIPTIWEWDGGNAPMRSRYTQAVNNYFSTATYRDSGFVWLGFEGGDIFGAGDRPIGLLNTTWVPQGIFLTDELARFAASNSPSRIGTGIVEIRYAAETEDYSMYFKIERIG